MPGGVAQEGGLVPGDRLLFVNDVDLVNASLDAAVKALKSAPPGIVRIGLAKPIPLHDEVEIIVRWGCSDEREEGQVSRGDIL